ncbi:DeoR/GlpR family DNA-binding transcription regulator [Ruminiclostridium cellobioparum]|uniref:Transcriptional regulators of sugar metabolism n=1 Tax=Ruminiclostridium cellobioparum subsp. termitidis CT1112 TaxID=1195236 RepID=S0FNL4_RUMCE|nr:DeoR/GlpR family DNA-binding transcription regulator [Ruminiclostridium cellobioparum]EMS70724.1 Transcriptional regulators of sugar metabolism [Ruminiclostridium cellobioparum subsp. termitidis CT1112]
MLPSERQNKLLELLSSKDIVTIPEFIAEFDVSIETVRRDLSILESQGKIEKVYGGAKIKNNPFAEPSMEKRMVTNLRQKECIGKKCCEFINDGDCIFIDSGTTPYYISKFLTNKKNLTVITNSIPVVTELMNTDFDIIIIGGMIRKSERSVVSYDYLFDFSVLSIQKSFICAGGITADNGVSDYNMQEVVTRKMIIERSKEIFLVADSSKFGEDVTIGVTPVSKLNYIITDSGLNKNLAAGFSKHKVKLVIAEL